MRALAPGRTPAGTVSARLLAGGLVVGAVVALAGCGAPPGSGSTTGGAAASPPASVTGQTSTSATASVGTATGHLVTIGPPTPTPRPTPLPSPSRGTVTLTEQSSGATVPVLVGATVVVSLGTSSSPYAWSEVSSSNSAVLRRTASSLAGGGASATFVVAAPGSAQLTAVDSPHCTPACGAASRLWEVTVLARA